MKNRQIVTSTNIDGNEVKFISYSNSTGREYFATLKDEEQDTQWVDVNLPEHSFRKVPVRQQIFGDYRKQDESINTSCFRAMWDAFVTKVKIYAGHTEFIVHDLWYMDGEGAIKRVYIRFEDE